MTRDECPVAQQASLTPHHPAVMSEETVVTYSELDRLIEHAIPEGTGLYSFVPGLQQLQDIVTLFAALRARRLVFPLSHRLPEAGRTALLAALGDTGSLTQLGAGLLVATSGSTGRPKIALLTTEQWHTSAATAAPLLGITPNSRWLASLPLFHVGGIAILFRCFLQGATVVAPHTSLAEDLQQREITHVSLVPTQLYRIMQEITAPPPPLHLALVGGAPCPAPLHQQALERGWPVRVSYGLTEMGSLTAMATRSGDETLIPLPQRRVEIASNGEIWVQGPMLFRGYVEQGHVIRQLQPGGWWATGDLGEEIGEGRFRILGRRDALFISGGENIQPEEIEAHLLAALPPGAEAVVVPQEDLEFGMRPVAFLASPQPWCEEALRSQLAEQLPRFKIPIQFRPFPGNETSGWKRSRAALQQLLPRVGQGDP